MFKKIISILMVLLFAVGITQVNAQTGSPSNKTQVKVVDTSQAFVSDEYKLVSSLVLVEQPAKYLNKKIKIKAKFDKFTAIGLDYPPVKRDAKTYISFLIRRENVTAYNIPLSELKLMVKRDYAEKELVNLETGDEIDIYGTVFSTALGDPWVDVQKVVILTQKADKTKK